MHKLTENELVKLIEYHDRLYWNEGNPEISDEEYDELVRRLETISPKHPILTRINAPKVLGSAKVRHERPMLSLDKAYSLEDLLKWAEKYARSSREKFLIQPKYDGISANFKNGVLATRGDGEEGEDISDKLPLIELETNAYKGPVNRQVRGEIVIRNDDFKTIYSKIVKKDGKPYKNSRNAVAGIMGLKDITFMVHQKAKLTLIDYDMVSYNIFFSNFEQKWSEILSKIENLPYPMDGIVVKIADEVYRESLGHTAHHPRGEIAFKFSGIRRQTELVDVIWSFGKNSLTPVAQLAPVEIGGITIKQATLHNIQNVIDKDLMIGDKVTVERAGDVIPYIVDSQPGSHRKTILIEYCPSCNALLAREGPEIKCVNSECMETRVQRLLAAVKSIGIEHLGEPNIRRMISTLKVKSLKDIFALSKGDILNLEGFKEKSSNNLYNEIQSAKKVNDFQLLASLNIQGIGKNVAKKILEEYTIAEIRKLNKEQFSEIEGIGPERAEALFSELEKQSEYIDDLFECVNLIITKDSRSADTVCFTGKMPEKRSYYENLAQKNGYEAVDNVNKELSILVVANTNEKSSKVLKADNLGIKILTLEEWLRGLKDKELSFDTDGKANNSEGLFPELDF